MLNRVTLIGNVGKDPEIKHTQGGKPWARFSLATSEKWRDRESGEQKEKTEWHNIVIWNESLVKVVEQYVQKGQQIYIEGQLQTNKYTDENGVERYSTQVVLQGFNGMLKLLGRKGGNGHRPDHEPDDESAPPSGRPERTYDDEIPF